MSAESGYFYNLSTARSDPRIAYVLLNHARRRTLERVFGVPEDQQFLLLLILLGMAGRAVSARAQRALDAAPGAPSRNSLLIGTSMLDEAVHMLAGDSTPDAPLIGSLVAFALLAAVAKPVTKDIQAAARTMRAELARIPQWIIRLNSPEGSESSAWR